MWKKFATLMMFLSIIETVFEAVPQAILGICFSIHQLKHSSLTDNESRLMHLWETYPFQVDIKSFFEIFKPKIISFAGCIFVFLSLFCRENSWNCRLHNN